MKPIINSSKRTSYVWFNVSIAILTYLIFLAIPSCQKDMGFLPDQESVKGQDILPAPELSSTASTIYYGPKTLKITSGTSLVLTQTITNPNINFSDFDFVLKIQNSSNLTTRVTSGEIRIDGILIVSSKDFSNILITKKLTSLRSGSILTIKLYGPTGSFITLRVEGTLKTVTDRDGNIYNTVRIGTQVWLKQNLKTTKYNDGTSIPNITVNTDWQAVTTPGYCWYNNNVSYKSVYGALYNWYSVNTAKLCPTGWHVPTDAQWTTLATYLGGESVAGGKLKEAGTTHWISPNTGATNSSGFTALPGGYRDGTGPYYIIGYNGYWWSSTQYSTTPNAWNRSIPFGSTNVFRNLDQERHGFSVRCLRNN